MNEPTEAEQPVVLLLAAGASVRYGAIKQLAEIEGQPMLRRIAGTVLKPGCPVIVVTGAQAEHVETALDGMPVTVERHARWAEGMGSSLAAGVRRARMDFPAASGVLICLGDQPLLDIALLERMLARHRAAPDAILAASRDAVDAPPVLFPRDCLEALSAWSGSRGALELIRREAHRVERFDSTGLIDVDTPEDLQRARERLAAKSVRR